MQQVSFFVENMFDQDSPQKSDNNIYKLQILVKQSKFSYLKKYMPLIFR